jgi:hypothetical protein
LTVTVAYPPEWGNSPQTGEGKCGDTRKGYEFGVEFIPLFGYGFEKWLAFKTADYADLDKNKSAAEVEGFALNGKGVAITESESDTGAKTARVTIDILEPVTLVPWCDSRPHLTQQTNPPINPIPTPFPYDQQINIWFSIPVKSSTLTSNNIRIVGIYTSGNNRGQYFNGNGDLITYFTFEIPAGSNNRLNLIPKPGTAQDLQLLSISVTVGPGIESTSGVSMAQAETITYQTDTREAQKAYKADSISASRNAASGYFTDGDWGNPDKDRRFKQNDKNKVYIRFSVDAPSGEGVSITPNKIRIVERKAYTLSGGPTSGAEETTYTYPGTGVTISQGVFTIEHTLKTGDSCIIQLLVLPFYDPSIPEMPENEAVSEGRYVTVVMDNAAPYVDDDLLRPSLSAPSSMDGDIYVYGQNEPMTLTLRGLARIADNGGDGISLSRAYSFPWTMDEPQSLLWSAQIGTDNTQGVTQNSGWKNVYKTNGIDVDNTWELTNLSGLTPDVTYPILVKYKDGMGNESVWNNTELQVKYSIAEIEPVSDIRAEYNAANSQITVSWDELSHWESVTGTYPYPEIVITTYRASAAGDMEENTTTVTRNRNVKTYSFSVPKINDAGVRNGSAVSGVYGYKVSVISHNLAGNPVTGPIWIYNIPDMVTQGSGTGTDSNTVRITSADMNELTAASSSGKNFILTKDIALSTWEPITAFYGSFYGNGHTITIGSMNATSNAGLFGSVQNCLVRDLTVHYYNGNNIDNNKVTIASSSFGGVTFTAAGNSQFINMLVSGNVSVNINDTIKAGGLVGDISGTSSVKNAYVSLNLSAISSGSSVNDFYVGGIAGNSSTTWKNGEHSFSACTVTGNITVTDTHIGQYTSAYIGGIIGYINTDVRVSLIDCVYEQGIIDVITNKQTYLGGIIGYVNRLGIFSNCYSNATKITVKNYDGNLYFGGFVGSFNNSEFVNCGNSSPIMIDTDSTSTKNVNAGGFVGFFANYFPVSGKLENCWSIGDLFTFGKGTIYTGGLIGNTHGAVAEIIITRCWSTGNVSAIRSGGEQEAFSTGGLVGAVVNTHIKNSWASGSVNAQTNNFDVTVSIGGLVGNANVGSITNCYALGNVMGDITNNNSGREVYAGGLVGQVASVDVQYNFAAGSINARTNGSYEARAGGVVGYIYSGNVKNNVALGASVTAIGSSIYSKSAARIYGNPTTAPVSGTSNNYAKSSMRTGTGDDYNAIYLTTNTHGESGTGIGDTQPHGDTVEDSIFYSQNIWKSTSYLGFSEEVWNFNSVTGKGYPRLAWE